VKHKRLRNRAAKKLIIWAESEKGDIAVSNISPDDLFVAIQPNEQSRQQAREWIKNESKIIS
jgi:hypothetical protein